MELTDFSVFYSQGLADSIAAEMKDGKSEVVCDAGALVKISKDRQGVITREVLTKKWTDWVDYWAVDWDFKDDTFHNQWQSYRTRKNLKLELSVSHEYVEPGKYVVVVKVIDILGNDTTKTLQVEIK